MRAILSFVFAVLGGCASDPAPDVDASTLPTDPAIDGQAAESSPSAPASSRAVCDREETVSIDGGRTVRTKLPCRAFDPVHDSPDPPL